MEVGSEYVGIWHGQGKALAGGGILEQLIGRALRQDAPVAHAIEPVTEQRLIHTVGDEDEPDRVGAGPAHDGAKELPARLGLDPGRRLIENEVPWLHGENGRD